MVAETIQSSQDAFITDFKANEVKGIQDWVTSVGV